MSTFIVNTVLGKDFDKLSGPENYDSWVKEFEPVATMNGCFGLYLGTDEVVGKPARPDFIPKVAPSSDATPRPLKSADDEVKAQSTLALEAPENYAYYIAVYNAQVQDWKDNDKNVRFACALLRAAVEPWIWSKLSTANNTHPQKAWDAIQKAWDAIQKADRALDRIRLQCSLARLDTIKLYDPSAIRPFLFQFEDVYNDIIKANSIFTRSRLIKEINGALPRQYEFFVQSWRVTHYSASVDDELFKKYHTLLLRYADDHMNQWVASKERDNKAKNNSSQTPKRR